MTKRCRRRALVHGALFRGAGALVLALAAVFLAGCTGRFSTHTEYLAPDFTRESLRGRTIAVLPPPGGAGAYEAELTGVALGLEEAGARVRIVPTADRGAAGDDVLDAAQGADNVGDRPPPEAPWFEEPLPSDATYVLAVSFTDACVYRTYRTPRDRGGGPGGRTAAVLRTSGRRVGLRLTLVRQADGAATWLASGSGEMWRQRSAAAPGVAPAALTVDEDLGAGNLTLYPPPPSARTLSRRLVRRLLAVVPSPPPLQPN